MDLSFGTHPETKEEQNAASFLSQGLDFSVSVEELLAEAEPAKPPPREENNPQAGGGLPAEIPGWGGHDPYAVMSVKYTELTEQANQMAAKLRDARTNIHQLEKEKSSLQRDKTTLEQDLSEAQVETRDLEQQLEDAFNMAGSGPGPSRGGKRRFARKGGALGGLQAEEQRRLEEERRAMLEDNDDMGELDELDLGGGGNVNPLADFAQAANAFFVNLTPFAGDIQHIQAQYGAGVAAFFKFCRWILMQFGVLALISILFIIVHFSTLASRSSSSAWDLLSFDLNKYGLFPKVFAFSSHEPSEAIIYASVLFIYAFWLVLHTLIKWRSEDRETVMAMTHDEEQKNFKFSKAVLSAWDNGVHSSTDSEQMQRGLYQRVVQLFAEKDILDRLRKRTKAQKAVIFSRRFLGFFLYIGFQAASWAIILALTTGRLSDYMVSIPESLSSVLVPAVVTIINTIMPVLVTLVTSFEAWDRPGTKIRMLIVRTYLAKVLNAAIQVVSVHLLADPFAYRNTLSAGTRYAVEKRFLPDTFTCRADMAWLSLYQLVVVEFVMGKLVDAGVPIGKMIMAAAMGKPFKRSEYKLEVKMVSTLYFQALVFATLPFGPSLVPIFTVFMVINFLWAQFELNHFLSKPAPFDVRSVAKFFVELYFLTLVLLFLVPLNFFFQSNSLPNNCDIFDEHLGLCKDKVVNGVCNVTIADDDARSDIGEVGEYAVLQHYTSNYLDAKYYSATGTADHVDYPWAFCRGPDDTYACGPFTKKGKPYEVLRELISSPPGGSFTYQLVSQDAIILWAIVLMLFFALQLRQNRVANHERVAEERARNHQTEIQLLQFKYQKAQRECDKYKRAEELTRQQRHQQTGGL